MKKQITTTQLVSEIVPKEKIRKRIGYFSENYPNSVPIFVQYGERRTIHRYLVPKENSYGHLLMTFRHALSLKSSQGLISLVEKQTVGSDGKEVIKCYQVPTSMSIKDMAAQYIHDDGFLYINITTENVFG